MLSAQTIAIVKSTAKVLEEHGETLTRHFYKRMFSHNPEVRPFFNQAHQMAGNQQKALAQAICAYAANIDNLSALSEAVELIAQKHASLQIKAEHYPIVGENLLASIQEVLGLSASDNVIKAWSEAYQFLADILIDRESQIYQDHVKKGWEGFKPFQVFRKQIESELITSFYLIPVDRIKLPIFKPGQYITVRFKTSDGLSTTMRNYSLSDKPNQDWFRISVKREMGSFDQTPGGYVSNFLHDSVEIGSIIEVAPPCGEFFLDMTDNSNRPLVFLAGGVGITPIFSMLLCALENMPNRKIALIHGSLNENTQAFRKDLLDLMQKYPNLKVHFRYSEQPKTIETLQRDNASMGFIDARLIESVIADRDADYYFCGPQPFMGSIYQILQEWQVPPSQIHFEFFGPKQTLTSKQITNNDHSILEKKVGAKRDQANLRF